MWVLSGAARLISTIRHAMMRAMHTRRSMRTEGAVMLIEKMILDEQCNVTLTAYVATPSNEMPASRNRPAMLIFPGGGYQMCSDREAEPIALRYVAAGFNAFVLRYSLGADSIHPKPLRDAEQAMDLLIEHADRWQIDPDRIAVTGFSAGGHLATTLGTMGRIKPRALVLGYPHIFEYNGRDDLPVTHQHVTSDTPPSFIFHTFEDTVVPVDHALAFAQALRDHRVPFELHVFQQGEHGLALANAITAVDASQIRPDAAVWMEMAIRWLGQVLG